MSITDEEIKTLNKFIPSGNFGLFPSPSQIMYEADESEDAENAESDEQY
jgi:hypothetical protein